MSNPRPTTPPKRPASAPNLTTPEAVSQWIDEEIRKEAVARREAKRKEVKVLLLGQAESGKSTLQKHFQLLYAQDSLQQERPAWRPVVYLNIIKAARMILSELEFEFETRKYNDRSATDLIVQHLSLNVRTTLLPLIAMEDALASEINGGVAIPGGRSGAFVHSGWQYSKSHHIGLKLPETATMVAKTLSKVSDDIKALWQHPTVQQYIAQGKIRVEESTAFFIGHISRISQPDYMPTTDDILRVRLPTLGIDEHRFSVPVGPRTYDWRLFDVGGARGQRQAWVPFFDDAVAIIFLAPISAFDQYLEEDPKVNRIDDSLQLFTSICANRIFKDVHLVLFLNKTDILREKLLNGVKIRKYITSYGNRANTYDTAVAYFRQHFIHSHKKHSTESTRHLYLHCTSMMDTSAIQSIIAAVGESILQKHISRMGLI